jgi:NADPH-dependent 2,4-dienoyl-CoA reductase/sulfur reductase-like enzyme
VAQSYKLLIVGGGLAAVSTLDVLAKEEAASGTALLSSEPHLPYDRPPLSKEYLLRQTPRDEVFLKPESFYKENGIDVFLNTRAAKLDTTNCLVTTEDGRSFRFEKLMIATGSELRTLNVPGHELTGVHYLRRLDDSDAIQSAAKDSTRAVVVGAGFIGLEVAAALRQMGLEVTVLEMEKSLFPRLATPELSDFFLHYYEEKGVRFLFQERIETFEGKDRLMSVRTASGLKIPCDLAVVGVGVRPSTAFLDGTGVDVSNGVIVNEYMETNLPGIYAGGDVANYYDPVYRKRRRIEHWDNAIKQGNVVGENLLGRRAMYDGVSYFFSDVWDLHWQLVGDNEESDTRIVRGSMGERKFGVLYLKDNRLRAMFLLGLPFKERRVAEKFIMEGVDLSAYAGRLADVALSFEEIAVGKT